MKYALLLFALTLGTVSYGQANKALDTKNGFRALHFGDDIGRLPEAELVTDDGNSKIYSLPHDKLRIGDAKLEGIYYGFYKGKFYEVQVLADSKTDGRLLKSALDDAYGPSKLIDSNDQFYSWRGEKVVMYYSEAGGLAWKMQMTSNLIKQQMNKDKKPVKKVHNDL